MSTRQENKDRGPKTEGNTQKARDREEQETECNMQNGKGRGAETEAAFFISGRARRVAMAFRKTDEHKTREQIPRTNDRGQHADGQKQRRTRGRGQHAEWKRHVGRDRSSIFHKWVRAAGGNGLSEDR